MSSDGNKFTQYLDQLIPFLESSPTWLKIWIYIQIFLIFLTLSVVSIYYLKYKSDIITQASLKSFTVENPKDNGEIPLDESKTWILEGKFPVTEDNIGKIEVDVFESEPIRRKIDQSGQIRISNINGIWSYESAHFSGEGQHEIVVSAYLGKDSTYQRLKVNCISKATLFKKAIENDRQIRGVQPLVLANPSEISLPDVQQQLYQMQTEFFQYFPRDLDQSQTMISKTLEIVDSVLPLFPNDLYLQNARAYTFKNYAMVMQRLGRKDESERALNESARMFEAIRQQNPTDAGAWNGLGSVSALRGNLETALSYINRALEINPNYPAALEDKKEVLGRIEERGGVPEIRKP
jgi:tetratricopeptide (TPR) repeat protein